MTNEYLVAPRSQEHVQMLACLYLLDESCRETVDSLQDMEVQRLARRRALAPAVRQFKELAAWPGLIKKMENEVDELSRGHAARLDDMHRLQTLVQDAARAFARVARAVDGGVVSEAVVVVSEAAGGVRGA
jgi:hypothetical protein